MKTHTPAPGNEQDPLLPHLWPKIKGTLLLPLGHKGTGHLEAGCVTTAATQGLAPNRSH